jgi:hypothetical protein
MTLTEQKLFAKLPVIFRTKDVFIESHVLGRSRSWGFQALELWQMKGMIKKKQRGLYQKISGENLYGST